jgi:hypothetical protein
MTQRPPLTFDEWLRRMGQAPLPPLAVDLRELDERDYNAVANALIMWLESQRLTEGQGVIVMTEVLGRVLGARMAENLPIGLAGAQATMEAIAASAQVALKRKLGQ